MCTVRDRKREKHGHQGDKQLTALKVGYAILIQCMSFCQMHQISPGGPLAVSSVCVQMCFPFMEPVMCTDKIALAESRNTIPAIQAKIYVSGNIK